MGKDRLVKTYEALKSILNIYKGKQEKIAEFVYKVQVSDTTEAT